MIVRRIGIGDRQHVRNALLSVGLFCGHDVTEQTAGAIAAAEDLGMMLRVHVNADCVMGVPMHYLMHRNVNHQLECWHQLTRPSFESIFNNLDLLITEPEPAEIVHAEILRVWAVHGGRFLNGNFGHLTDQELQAKYPELYPDSTTYWEAWNA